MQLYDVLTQGYKKSPDLTKHGFIKDESLSNHNQQTYYNPKNKKLIFNVSGSHNLSDIKTDVLLGLGRLKNTKRYMQAHQGLRQAKEKYHKVDGVTVTGDSLGGGIAGYISSRNDKVSTLNKASILGAKLRTNENTFRVEGDPISLFQVNKKRMLTLPNKNVKTHSSLLNAYNAHIPKSIKNHNIKI